jgi:hypothetical protein
MVFKTLFVPEGQYIYSKMCHKRKSLSRQGRNSSSGKKYPEELFRKTAQGIQAAK